MGGGKGEGDGCYEVMAGEGRGDEGLERKKTHLSK